MADERKNVTGYKACKNYFVRKIREVKAETDALREEMKKTYAENRSTFKTIGKKSAGFYGNNLLGFFMSGILLLLPFALLAVLIRMCGSTLIVSLIPMMVVLVIMIAVMIVRLVKRIKFIKELPLLCGTCVSTEAQLAEQNKNYKVKRIKEKKMLKIYKICKQNPAMSMEKIETLKAKFDQILAE